MHGLIRYWLQTGVSIADLSMMHGEVLLLRHMIKLMTLDLQLRVKVFYLRERHCEKLIYNSILWRLYAVQRLSKPSTADIVIILSFHVLWS